MCGDFCAMKKGMEVFKDDIKGSKLSPCLGKNFSAVDG
jgi:phosphomethylpyrimidine synthase